MMDGQGSAIAFSSPLPLVWSGRWRERERERVSEMDEEIADGVSGGG